MNRRNFLRNSTALAAAAALPGAPRALAAASDRPNLLFLFADDQSWETLHAFGSEVETPNLDRLVARGTTFTHAYNMGAWGGAVCVASRTMLVTGRTVWRARALEQAKKKNKQADTGKCWSQLLHDVGYHTYFSGKWHVTTHQAETVFDTVGHVRGGMPKQTPEGYNRPKDENDKTWLPWDKSRGGHWEGGKHWSEVLGDEGVEFLQTAAKQDEPFFMYLAFNAPHDPRQSPKEFVDRYPVDKVKLPENFLPEYPFKDKIGCGNRLRDERLAPFPRTPYAVKVNRQEYYAIITHMDQQVGRILAALEASGKADNTYVFFTADHGLACGHHGLMGKQNMFEHSMRAPLMVCGPTVPQGQRVDTPVYLQDIMPTTLELARAPLPDYVEFKSLLPLIHGDASHARDAVYGAYLNLQRMVVDDGWKLIYYPGYEKFLLFNLQEDPLEQQDLAEQPAHRQRLTQLKDKLRQLQREMGDTGVQVP